MYTEPHFLPGDLALMFLNHFYYFRKSIQPKYSYTPTGDLDINQLLRNKPYWRQSVPATVKENKTLILADWTAENWSAEKRTQVISKLVELINEGFSIYAWQSGQIEELSKDNLVQLLKEPQFLERMTSPVMPKDIEAAVITQLPNVTKDNILILDDYQINGLIHPEAFDYPRELDASELLQYKQNRDKLLPILGKMNPPIAFFTDTQVSDESYLVLEQLQTQLPEITIKSQFKSAKLTNKLVQSLVHDGQAQIARRLLSRNQLQDLEEVTLEGLSLESLLAILPYLSTVKKLTLLNFTDHLNIDKQVSIALPNLEKIKLVGTTILTTDLVSIIKNSPLLQKIAVYSGRIEENGPLTSLTSQCLTTIKSKHGGISKKNFQDLVRYNKINRVLFADVEIISDSLIEIKDSDLSSIKILEIETCICNATYLNQMFELLPQLEHLSIHGGTIKRFTNTFSLKNLKILDIDLDRFNDIASAFDNLQLEQLILVDKNTADIPQLSKLNLSRMHYFELSNNQLNHKFVEDTLNRSSGLKHLNLRGCTNLQQINKKLSLANIDTLNLSKTDISAESLEVILNSAPNLKRLDLSGCGQLMLTPALRNRMNRIQVYYPDHIKIERKKPTYSSSAGQASASFLKDGITTEQLLELLNHIPKQKTGQGGSSTTGQETQKLKIEEDPKADAQIQIKDDPNGVSIRPNSQEQFVDADTSLDNNKEFSVNLTFFPINQSDPIPAVSQYREQLFNHCDISEVPCTINQAFKVNNTGYLELKPCDAKVSSQDLFKLGSQLEHSTEHQYYYGKTSFILTNEWQPLPSLSAQEKLTHYHIEPNLTEVDLQYSARDSQYYIRSKTSGSSTIAIDFLLKVPTPTKKLPLGVQQLVDLFAGSLSEPGYGSGPLTVDAKNPTGMDYLNAILKQKKGACRQRAIAFYSLMKERFPAIPLRIMSNTVHMQAEVLIEGEWISCNLGGYPAKLNLDKKNDPRTKEQTDICSDPESSELLKEDAQIAQFLQTWKKTKQPELALETYCDNLIEPRQQKKYLVETSNSASLQLLAQAIKDQGIQNDRPLFYINKPDKLSCSGPFVTNEGNVGIVNEGPGGPLYDFLTKTYDKSKPPILLINADQFDTDDLVQHNSLFDDQPKADGIALPEGTIVIVLRNSSNPNFILGEDLTSRMDLIEQCPVSDKVLNLAYPPLIPKQAKEETRASAVIDLFHSANWECLLLGQWTINGNQLCFEEGLLQAALKEQPVINLRNGLWENPAFKIFWQEAVQNGFIDYEGQRIEFPTDFELVIEEGHDWKTLAELVEFSEGFEEEAGCLNPSLFNSFFFQYECIEQTKGMKKGLGLIEKAAGKKLVINLTRELDENDWARLLTECKKHKVHLVCHCAPGIVLPEPFKEKYHSTEGQETELFSATNRSPCMIIKSTDRDTTIAQLTQQLDETIFIDVSELESFDVQEQLQGCYKKETRQFEFVRIEKVLNKALRENKNVILTGQCSNSLLDGLMPLLLRHSNKSNSKNTLALVVDVTCEYQFPHATKHEVSVEEKVAALELEYTESLINRLTKQQLEEESLSQLKARVRYFKKHPTDKDSTKAWDGLKALSSQVELAPFDLNKSEEKARASIKGLVDDILSRLKDSPTLYLSGLTGVGKTTFIEKHLGKEPNVALYSGEEHLKDWAEDKSEKLKVLFIDEANISQRQWSEFEGLFMDPPSIVINGTHYWLKKDHVVIFAGNPLNYGNERQLATLFKRHGNAKVFEPMTGEFIYEMILKPLFANTELQDQSKEISKAVLELYRYLVGLSTNEVLISARELQLIVLLILSCHHHDKQQDSSRIAAHYIHQIGSTMVPYEHRKDFDAMFKPKEPLYTKQSTTFKLEHSDYLITPSRQEIYRLILDLLQLSKYRKIAGHNEAQKFGGMNALILEGEPGIGKSELVKAVLQELMFEEASLNEESTADDVYYQMPISMRNEQKQMLFLRVLAENAKLIMDEINSAPMMERWLNDLLMNKNPITKTHPDKPGLTLFGTQNPATMAGRQKPSNAVKRRTLHYVLPNYPPEEMVPILVNEGCTEPVAEQMVRIYVHLVNYARQNYLSPAPTFRDLLRLARIFSKLSQVEALNAFYASVDKPALRQAVVKAASNFDSDTLLELAKQLTPETVRIFDLHIGLFERFIVTKMTAKKVAFMLEFLTLIMPKVGQIDDNKIEYFTYFCDLNSEEEGHLEWLNKTFTFNSSLMEHFFKSLKTTSFPVLIKLVSAYIDVDIDLMDLLTLLLAEPSTELLSAFIAEEADYFSLIRTYLLNNPEADAVEQLALIKTYRFLLKNSSAGDTKVLWRRALLEVNGPQLIKLQKEIDASTVDSYGPLFHSIFNTNLLEGLKNDEKFEYIKLMLEDELTRKLFQSNKASFNTPNAFRKYFANLKNANPQEIIELLSQFQGYPELIDYLFSNSSTFPELFAVCKNKPDYYADFIKAYGKSNAVVATPTLLHIKLLEIYSLLNEQALKDIELWRFLLLESRPDQITKMHLLLANGLSTKNARDIFFQLIGDFVCNEQMKLSTKNQLSYLQLIPALSAEEIGPFQQLTSLMSKEIITFPYLLEKLKTIPLNQVLKATDFINSYLEKQTCNEVAITHCLELHQFLSEHALQDKSIWLPILLDTNLDELNKLHQWMSRYKQDKPLVFLNLLYSKAHQRTLSGQGTLSEDALLKYTDTLLSPTGMALFDFNKWFKFSQERVNLIHHLENKTFVVPRISTIKSLWTDFKNSTLLNSIYDAYSKFLGRNKENKAVLLLVAKELTEIPNAKHTPKINQKLASDLSGVVTNYLHSFWIRTQRKNSARSLLDSINNKDSDYKQILNSIQRARNEVFTNDTEKERNMHRWGSSRYYQTLNQLEDALIGHWIKDRRAVTDFKEYLTHYETTLNHSKQCLDNAIKHENKTHNKAYDENTKFEDFPGYIRALKREVQLREESFKKYQSLVTESMLDYPKFGS